MTSYTRDSDDVIKILMLLRAFVPEYHHAMFGGDWAADKGETSGGNLGEGSLFPPPAYISYRIAQRE